MNRRVLFFLLAATAAGLLVPVSQPELRWVAEAVAVTYLVLALLAFLDSASRR